MNPSARCAPPVRSAMRVAGACCASMAGEASAAQMTRERTKRSMGRPPPGNRKSLPQLSAQPRHRAESLRAQPADVDADRALDLKRNRLPRHRPGDRLPESGDIAEVDRDIDRNGLLTPRLQRKA